MRAVVQGALNKQIAYELGITEVTVKLHRSSLMRKMRAPFVTHLVRAWQSLPAELREEPIG
jgi:FixJ family two-component response regulator